MVRVHPSELTISPNCPFTLPRRTILSSKHFQDLFCSEILLGKCSLGLNQKLLKDLKENYNSDAEESDDEKVLKIVNILQQELSKVVNFTCSGPANKELPSLKDDKTKLNQNKTQAEKNLVKETTNSE